MKARKFIIIFVSLLIIAITLDKVLSDTPFDAYIVSSTKGEIAVTCQESWTEDDFYICHSRN